VINPLNLKLYVRDELCDCVLAESMWKNCYFFTKYRHY